MFIEPMKCSHLYILTQKKKVKFLLNYGGYISLAGNLKQIFVKEIFIS